MNLARSSRRLLRAIESHVAKRLPSLDRRCRFRDLSKLLSSKRMPASCVLQFYSSVDNIGNYLPVLGIQQLLGEITDTWCVHDRQPDFDFINRSYKGVIVGGAGLLHGGFECFWRAISRECKLPIIVWGVGGCYPDNKESSPVPANVAGAVFERCDLINLRDDVTADYYHLPSAHLSPCPTIAYLQAYNRACTPRKSVTFSNHAGLVSHKETAEIARAIACTGRRCVMTNNEQTVRLGLDDIIRRFYCPADVVVTTRLHGAIVAYGLGVPYIAVPRDEKLRAFHRLYGNGVAIHPTLQVADVLHDGEIRADGAVRFDLVADFGKKAKDWMQGLR